MERDQQFLEFVVKSLVDNPDDVKIDRIVDEMGVLLKLSVHRDDMGKIIGRSGATAKAIRTILRVVGMKNDARVNLKIEEPEGSTRSDNGASNDEPTGPIDRSVDDLIDELKGGTAA
ncbi:KH domain-containing protein [Candidatus Kaiserbacteria bacterium]|nr:KH domain-containing protein [Candidatus Kaiserbacteria bacterium]